MVPYIHVPDLHLGPLRCIRSASSSRPASSSGPRSPTRRAGSAGSTSRSSTRSSRGCSSAASSAGTCSTRSSTTRHEIVEAPVLALHAVGGAQLVRRLHRRRHRGRALEVLRRRPTTPGRAVRTSCEARASADPAVLRPHPLGLPGRLDLRAERVLVRARSPGRARHRRTRSSRSRSRPRSHPRRRARGSHRRRARSSSSTGTLRGSTSGSSS